MEAVLDRLPQYASAWVQIFWMLNVHQPHAYVFPLCHQSLDDNSCLVLAQDLKLTGSTRRLPGKAIYIWTCSQLDNLHKSTNKIEAEKRAARTNQGWGIRKECPFRTLENCSEGKLHYSTIERKHVGHSVFTSRLCACWLGGRGNFEPNLRNIPVSLVAELCCEPWNLFV